MQKLNTFLPYLLKTMFVFFASSFYCKLCTEDITKFCTITIATTCKNNKMGRFNENNFKGTLLTYLPCKTISLIALS